MYKRFINIICILIILIMGCSSNTTHNNNGTDFNNMRVDSVFQSYFSFINNALEDSLFLYNEVRYEKFSNIIDFLEEISGISSQREGTFLGLIYKQPLHVEEDFIKWKNWYYINKNQLYWDNINKKVIKHHLDSK